jgi:hypothetical protein
MGNWKTEDPEQNGSKYSPNINSSKFYHAYSFDIFLYLPNILHFHNFAGILSCLYITRNECHLDIICEVDGRFSIPGSGRIFFS